MPEEHVNPEDLVIHVLNVGNGDNIIIEFPKIDNRKRCYALVDCFRSDKTIEYLDKLIPTASDRSRLEFVVATHPHRDHILGINKILKHPIYRPKEFWESGFRHNTNLYQNILKTIEGSDIQMIRVSSGMESYYGKTRVTVLSPSVALRNRYATYGVDMNNSSVVLRLEHHEEDVLKMISREYEGERSVEAVREAGKSVVILAGDAEFDSWTHVIQDYPKLEKTDKHKPLVTKMINYLSCAVLKVSHHGSMHSASLDVYEKMNPEKAIISSKQEISTKESAGRILTRGLFPHDSTILALEECGANILTTDGSYESKSASNGVINDVHNAFQGSIVVVIPPGGEPWWKKLRDTVSSTPDISVLY